MKRLAVVFSTLTAVVAAVFLGAGGDGPDGYRVDAIFDNVAFLTDGQEVRVAGAPAGEVLRLEVTPDHKARVEMVVDEQFAPFREDADCTVQPQSLIGERFVQCTPGTPGAPALRASGDEPPTLAVERTHAPVDLDLILGTFDLPARERLGILLGSLGAGLAGRDEALGEAILRANPALQEARGVLEILERDRTRLARLVRDADTILGALAERRARVGDFVREAADVTTETARRAGRVAETTRRLPEFLDQARPALARLTDFARAGRPLMADLERAAPTTASLLRRVETLSTSLRPTLHDLAPVVGQARAALPDVAPQVRRLDRFAQQAEPASALAGDLLTSLRDQGAFDGLGSFLYYVTVALSRFDRISHILPNHQLGNQCGLYARTPVAGCSARYESSSRPGETAGRERRAEPRRRRATAQPEKAGGERQAPATDPAPGPDAPPSPPAAPEATRQLLEYLLG